MGSLAESSSLQTLEMMKSIAVVALCMFAAAAGEAEASSDAGVLYGHYGYGHHLGYGHHGYHGYGYPYRYHGYHYGKRSADAEPEAAADAGVLYGAYGYGHGLHGYYGHLYGRYGHGNYGPGYPYGH